MNYTIVYDRPGRIRFRCGGYAFEKRQEGAVKKQFETCSAVHSVQVHSENGSILVNYCKYSPPRFIRICTRI